MFVRIMKEEVSQDIVSTVILDILLIVFTRKCLANIPSNRLMD